MSLSNINSMELTMEEMTSINGGAVNCMQGCHPTSKVDTTNYKKVTSWAGAFGRSNGVKAAATFLKQVRPFLGR